jgi:hypothetical protein
MARNKSSQYGVFSSVPSGYGFQRQMFPFSWVHEVLSELI